MTNPSPVPSLPPGSVEPEPAGSCQPPASLPGLSVIVPNYNHAKYLERSLSAILHQSVQPLEVIVLDDASTDHSVEVIQRFVKHYPLIRLVRNEKNLGVMPNINKGLTLARGGYIHVSPADDEVVPGLFEKSLRLLARHPQAALCCTIAEWRETFSGLTWHMAAGMGSTECFLTPDELVLLGKKGKLCIISSSAIMRKGPLLDAGAFIPELRWHADWFNCYITGLRHGVCFIPEVLSLANLLPGSFFQAGSKRAEHRQVLQKLLELLNSKEYADVMPRVREAGELALFSLPMLRLLMARPEYRHFINLTLLRKTFRRSAELQAKKYFPAWLSRWFLRVFYRKPPAKSASA